MVDAPRDEAVQVFPTTVAIDTCAVWNVLSSRTITAASRGRCHFILAEYVRYECLVKPRKRPEVDAHLRSKLSNELTSGKSFSASQVTVDDLRQLVTEVGSVGRFHRGEFAALALARKLSIGFVTDDRAARQTGEQNLGMAKVRTTPHLVGWLVFHGHLSDSDIPIIIADNHAFRLGHGRLGDFIQKCYEHALTLRLIAATKAR